MGLPSNFLKVLFTRTLKEATGYSWIECDPFDPSNKFSVKIFITWSKRRYGCNEIKRIILKLSAWQLAQIRKDFVWARNYNFSLFQIFTIKTHIRLSLKLINYCEFSRIPFESVSCQQARIRRYFLEIRTIV